MSVSMVRPERDPAVDERLDRGPGPELVERGGPQLRDQPLEPRDDALHLDLGLLQGAPLGVDVVDLRALDCITLRAPSSWRVSSCSSRAQRRRSLSEEAIARRSSWAATFCAASPPSRRSPRRTRARGGRRR